jgi:lysophosphatidylcholine acyltransferase/lyso-PAF acetyltransferase
MFSFAFFSACRNINRNYQMKTKKKIKDFPPFYRQVRHIAQMSMRALYFVGSLHYIKYKGQRASPSEAAVLVGAPHTSYFDSLCVVVCGPSSVVAKHETASLPLFGSRSNTKTNTNTVGPRNMSSRNMTENYLDIR